MELGEAFRAVAALEQKSLALGPGAELLAQAARLAGEDQRRKVRELLFHALQSRLVGIVGDLPDRLAAPAFRRPGGAHGGPPASYTHVGPRFSAPWPPIAPGTHATHGGQNIEQPA